MKYTDLNAWLSYIEGLHPTVIELGLERVKTVAMRLNLLERTCPIITVAGTNGKGSCVAISEAILLSAGYQVGSYTSPHLLKYNERIRINGKSVSDDALCEAFSEIEEARGECSLTYFEFGTLAAFLLFKRANLDAWICEIGLGGRLDAVNIVDSDVAIIASIDFDHMEYLGNTREAIGYEKAGVIRSGKPVIYGEENIPTSIIQQAENMSAPLYQMTQDFGYQEQSHDWTWWFQESKISHCPTPKLALMNASIAMTAIHLLQDKLPVGEDAIKKALSTVSLPGRFEVIPGSSIQVFDVAHNPHSARLLLKNLEEHFPEKHWIFVFSALADKDIAGIIEPFLKQDCEWHVGPLDVPRAAGKANLKEVFERLKVFVNLYDSIEEAYQGARNKPRDESDIIIVFGSFYTVAQRMELRV
jgi:dihydrofolate synthase/folylpolyglutamate synthase